MAFPYSGPNGNAESVAAQIDQLAKSAADATTAWRAAVNGGAAVDSLQAAAVYQALVSLRAYVSANGSVPGLAAAYLRRFPGLPGDFNPVAEWAAADQAIVSFGLWIQANWPERSASGKPAFQQFDAATGVLEQFTVNLNAAARTALVGLLDAVLAAFTPG